MGNPKPALRDEHMADDDPAGVKTHGAVDPKPSPTTLTERSIRELVTTHDVLVRQDWGTARDAMDDLMRAYGEKGAEIEDAVVAYASEGEQLMQVSKVMREAAETARKEIGQHRHTTVTAFKARGVRGE